MAKGSHIAGIETAAVDSYTSVKYIDDQKGKQKRNN